MPTYEIITKTAPALTVASIREVIPLIASVGERFGVMFGAIDSWLKANHVQMTGPAFAFYYNEDYAEVNIDMEAAFIIDPATPVGSHTANGLPLTIRALPEELVASTFHHAGYETLPEAYRALLGWIVENGWRITGPSREIYLSMPGEANPLTEIQYPVAKA